MLILLVSLINLTLSSHSNPGHLKPFGTVGSLINIEEINGEYPNILKFFTYYLPKSEPILSRQVLINDQYYNIWKTDEQLENEVEGLSKANIYVESMTQRQRTQMKFAEFFDKYQKEHLFFADNIPEILRKYIVVPRPLQCDDVLPTIQSAIMLINNINTSPLMVNEEYNSLICLFRGNKRLTLVNTAKYPDIRHIVNPQNRQSQQPSVDPDRVDFDQFPEFTNIEYHVANLTAGDCLFIPINWVFQERSLDNTITVIYNIHHKQALNIDLNQIETCSKDDSYDSSFTLDQIDWASMQNEPRNFREIIMDLINTKSNTFEKWQETFSKHLSFDLASDSDTAAIFEELYGIIDLDGSGEVTIGEIELIKGAHQHHISDILYEIVKLVDEKQKSKTSKNDNREEALENEDTDEQLHLENYKTDL
ncbi:unnamed protein product [Adineta steineri]|uniref:Cupin-like domain-containing protein n=1 Tax=Adineta steineri TaxID=433720 RepID=A0A815AF68_9BILA|nr:unnamed protein product [Adineta steineri]CAF3674629.1 unnamed protein product [Adineta steineri]